MNEALNRLAARLMACQADGTDVWLFPHTRVDGDALGSTLALFLILEKMRVRAHFPLEEPVPEKLDFLPALDRIHSAPPGLLCAPDRPCLALLIDGSHPSRLGQRQAQCESIEERWVIDHHVSVTTPGPNDIIDTTSAAVGELIYHLIRILEKKLDQKLMDKSIAILLMTALMSDTGGFVFSNTSARTFQIASDLMHYKLELWNIAYRLFQQSSRERLCLMGKIFSNARSALDGKIIYASVNQTMMKECGAIDDDLDGVISHLRHVSGVVLALVFRQQADGLIRVNIRSSSEIDAARLARYFGGGGHPRASGLTLSGMTLPDAEKAVLEKAGELL